MGQDSIRHVLTAEASRMGLLWSSTPASSKLLEGDVLAAEASRIRLLWPSVMERVAGRAALLWIGGLMGQLHQRCADRGSVKD